MTQSRLDTPSHRTWERQINDNGAFKRRSSSFRDIISDKENAFFRPENDRYHLYVSLACPWAHRALITRALKGLEATLSVDVVDWLLPKGGWTLRAESDSATLDTVGGLDTLRQVYGVADANYDGAITVPVLWDRRHSTIVNNESSEIIRFLNSEFQNQAVHPTVDLYPSALRSEIDSVNDWIYPSINDGVYRTGFARSQEAYEDAVEKLFDGLERVESILSKQRYIAGDKLTEADIRLFPTLIRFDAVYHCHFKCTLKRITDYPNIWGYVRDLYSRPAFSETTNFEHIRKHYFISHTSINPHAVLPVMPEVDYRAAHDRAKFE
jgi:putative glutathione S-transferase